MVIKSIKDYLTSMVIKDYKLHIFHINYFFTHLALVQFHYKIKHIQAKESQ